MTAGPKCIGVAITVDDPAATARFYRELFGFVGLDEHLVLGGFTLELCRGGASGRSIPVDSQSNDRWFRHLALVVSDMPAAYRRLLDHGVSTISDGPQTLPSWNKDAAGIEALYFRDPDGHPLELIHFPPDKGKALWHGPSKALFQGVDHTAIVVSNTTASVAFYQDRLGFGVGATALNHGVEQEALSGVSGARVHATTLETSGSCGIELLEYLAPLGGRAIPSDTSADDRWCAASLVSGTPLRPSRINPLKDPDGHGVEIR